MDAEFIWDSKPWDDMLKTLRKKWDDIETRRKFGSILSAYVYRDIMEHFAKQAGPARGWPAWSQIYQKHMADIGKGGNMILQDSGRLRQSFTPASYRTSPEGLVFYNPAKTKKGFPYAKAHDEGGKKLPQRQFMWLSEKGMDQIVDAVESWLNPDSGEE